MFRSGHKSSVCIPYLGAAAPNVETDSDLWISEFSQSAPLPPLSVPSHYLQVRCFKGFGMSIINCNYTYMYQLRILETLVKP